MPKEFEAWNERKKWIQAQALEKFFREREIWWCSLGVNIGDEEDGKGGRFARPVVIIKKFNDHIFWGAALIGKKKTGIYYFPVGILEGKDASVVLSQVRVLDARRLIQMAGVITEPTFNKLKSALKWTLF